MERAFRFRSILNEFVAEYQRLPPAEEAAESERLKTLVRKGGVLLCMAWESTSLSVEDGHCIVRAYLVLLTGWPLKLMFGGANHHHLPLK